MAFSPNFHLAHFNQHRHLYDDEYCDHPDKDGRDDDVSDECQSVCEGIRVQYIPLTEIRFAIETVISKYSLFPYILAARHLYSSETLSPTMMKWAPMSKYPLNIEGFDFVERDLIMGVFQMFLQVRRMMALRGI